MKKLVATAAIAAVLGSAAFADINIYSWGRALWGFGNQWSGEFDDDGNKKDNDIVTANTQSWGGYGPRTCIDVNGTSDNVGYQLQVFSDGWSIFIGDNAKVWWQPNEMFRLELGKVGKGDLCGDAVYGLWDFYRLGAGANLNDSDKTGLKLGKSEEQWTFIHQDGNAVFRIAPMESLRFYASLCFPYGNDNWTYDSKEKEYNYVQNMNMTANISGNTGINGLSWKARNVGNMLGRNGTRYAAAYDIEGVGTIKAGVICDGLVATGKDGTDEANENVVNVAFDLKAVENLYVGIGAYIPTVQKIYNDDWGKEVGVGNRVNLAARFNATDQLTIHGRVGTIIGTWKTGKDSGDAKEDGQFGFLVGGCVDYAVMDSVTVFGEVDYASDVYLSNSTADNSDCLSFGVGVKKNYSNGIVGVAFEGATNNHGMFECAKDDDFAWCVPVSITYWF